MNIIPQIRINHCVTPKPLSLKKIRGDLEIFNLGSRTKINKMYTIPLHLPLIRSSWTNSL